MSPSAAAREVEVAIVGFGPSGAVAAGLLGAKGIRTFVCEKTLEVYDKPRAIALDHEILRLFQQMKLTDKIAPYMEPFTDSVFLGVNGQVIKRMSTVPLPYPMAHVPSAVFSQPPVEKILREHAAAHACVEVCLGWSLTHLEQNANCVCLTVQDASGAAVQVNARYLIACDGARSTVRTKLEVELEDLGFDEPWLVVDVLINEQGLSKIPATSMQYCYPERPASMIIGPGMHRRWEITLNADDDPELVATEEGTWKLLAPWITPADGVLWRQAAYRFHALVAKQWRVGRVFLAGDAAHQQPPFLGQGMCQGLRDVANLTWKLEAVLRQGANPDFLNTYGPERKAHVVELTTRIKGIGQLISQRDLARARARDAALLAACDGVVVPMPRQDVQPALNAGCLSRAMHAARGSLFPQAWMCGSNNRRVRMDEMLACGWRLILASDAEPGMVALAHSQSALCVAQVGENGFVEAEGVLAAWFVRHQVTVAIVRPDHYVFGVCANAKELSDQLKEESLLCNS